MGSFRELMRAFRHAGGFYSSSHMALYLEEQPEVQVNQHHTLQEREQDGGQSVQA